MDRRNFVKAVAASVAVGVSGISLATSSRKENFKIWAINDYELWAAETPEEAIAVAMQISGCDRSDYFPLDEIAELDLSQEFWISEHDLKGFPQENIASIDDIAEKTTNWSINDSSVKENYYIISLENLVRKVGFNEPWIVSIDC